MPESDSEMPDLDSPDAFESGGPAAPSAIGMTLSRSGLARALMIDTKTVDKAIRDGAPVLERGDAASRAPFKIDLAAFERWRIARAISQTVEKFGGSGPGGASDGEEAFDEEKRRDKAAQADLRELQVARLRNELVSMAEVVAFENQVATLFRSQANALFTQVRNLSPDQMQDFKDAVNAMLKSLTNYKPPVLDFTDVHPAD